MSKLSEILIEPQLPSEMKNNLKKCCSCHKEINIGGMWAMWPGLELSICERCSGQLLDWYIDTLRDTKDLDSKKHSEAIDILSRDIADHYIHQKIQLGKI